MSSSEPFLQPSSGGHGCFICGVDIVMRSGLKSKNVSFKKELKTIKDHAKKWANLDVPETDQFHNFTNANQRLSSKTSGYFHDNCLLNLRTKRGKYAEKTAAEATAPNEINASAINTSSDRCTRSSLPGSSEK